MVNGVWVSRAGDDELKVEETVLTELLGVAILVISLTLSYVLKKVEPWAERRHPYIGMTMRVLYKEFMSLGFISLIFTFIEIYVHPSSTVVHSFEFAHIFLFMLAIMNVIAVGGTTFTSLRISRRWKTFQALETVKYEEDKEEYEELSKVKLKHNNFLWKHFFWAGCNIALQARFNYLHEEMNFHDLRIQFLHYMNLPKHFNFSKYMRHVKSTIFVELVEISWTSWLALLVIFSIDCVRRVFYQSTVYDFTVMVAASWGNVVFIMLILQKIKHIYWELTKHPGLYLNDEGVDDGILDDDERMIVAVANEKAGINDDEELSSEERTIGTEEALKPERVYKESSVSSGYGRKEMVHNLYSTEPFAASNRTSELGSDYEYSSNRRISIPAAPNERVDSNVSGQSGAVASINQRRSIDQASYSKPGDVEGGQVNKTIVERAIENKKAKEATTTYPKWLTILIPRLKRVASPAEQLFWFGSNHFFSWLCQMSLLVSVVLVTLMLTDIVLIPPERFEGLYIAAFVSAIVTFIIVQFVLAVVMKKFTVVLNAAHLVEEELSAVLIEESLRDTLVEDFDADDASSIDDNEKTTNKRDRLFFLGWLKNRFR